MPPRSRSPVATRSTPSKAKPSPPPKPAAKRTTSPKPVATPKAKASPKVKASPKAKAEVEPLSSVLRRAGAKALGGGIAGMMAQVASVMLLMWLRTVTNYQYKHGGSMIGAFDTLWNDGGIPRLYQGWQYALINSPLARFGDTAANAGMLAILAGVAMPEGAKTFFASWAAAAFRIFIYPIDTFKTTLQTDGSAGLPLLWARIGEEGVFTLWSGASANMLATFAGHYPWFVTHNYLQEKIPKPKGRLYGLIRNALVGMCSSAVSDVVSNSIRVVKTAMQASATATSYWAIISQIIAADGLEGLFFRGLGSKLLSNALQAMLFTVLWRYLEEKLTAKADTKKKGK